MKSFFTDISRGCEDFARENGYNIIFCNTDKDYEKEYQCVSMFCEKMVDGIILSPSSNKIYEKYIYSTLKIPVVLVNKNIDIQSDKGVQLIEEIANIFNKHEINTEIITASIRNPIYVSECAMACSDIAIIPFGVLKMMNKHPLTDIGIKKFLDDYNK